VFKNRTRMVSFRLSEEEYERLKDLSLMECARSVSDFARAALCRLPNGDGEAPGEAAPRMDKLEVAVRQLRLEMHQLRLLVEMARGQLEPESGTTTLQENNQ
jgi:hypothetical protein